MKKLLIFGTLLIFLFSCSSKKEKADLILHNGVVYTVDSSFTVAEAFAVLDGKIIAVGSNSEILSKYESKEMMDAEGKAVFPGFIDAHCHFLGYGTGLQRVDLVGTKSFDEVLQRCIDFNKNKKSDWLLGRGWDQNDWEVKEFPDRKKLDSLFPNTPVILRRVDGHAAIANGEAIRRSGITEKSTITGGLFEVKNNQLTGILIDNAIGEVEKVIPPSNKEELRKALLDAQQNCFAVGLTGVDDAGLSKSSVELISEMQDAGELKMRIYVMLSASEENFEHYLTTGKKIKTDRLNVSSFKFYADGALGSRGACLLQPYSDKPGHIGFLLSNPEYYFTYSAKLLEKGFQMNTHCIGDSANRLILNAYAEVLKGKNDKRWRIEHCQVINKNDFSIFAQFSIVPSVQSTHATSDMYWAEDRVGSERVKGAYAYKDLLNAFGMVALGTDFPVEQINPMTTFYASVARKDDKGFPDNGFQTENALSREETLKGMTIWAAYSNFEENEKGSIEKGKFADFIILDEDIMKCEISKVLLTKVLYTYLNGEKVYSNK